MANLINSIGLRIALVALIVVVAFLLRDRVSGAAADLKVGDCFDQPATELQQIEDVLHHPCDEGHTGEVFHVFAHAVGSDAPYPTDDGWSDIVFPVCDTQFAIYTGRSIGGGELDYSMYTPTAEGWGMGDRQVICFLYRVDAEPMTRSFRAASN